MSRLIACAMLALALLATPNVGAAPIVIDTFDSPNPGAVLPPPTGPGALRTNDAGSGILGQRDFSAGGSGLVNFGDGARIGTATGSPFSGQGILDLAWGSASTFSITLNYDNFGTLALSPADQLQLQVLAYNNGSVTTQNTFTITTVGGTLTSGPVTFPNVNPGPQTFSFPLSSFTPASGSPNLSQVTGISLTFNTNGSAGPDITLDGIQVAPVPEPTTIALWSVIGLAGAWYARRRLLKAREPVEA